MEQTRNKAHSALSKNPNFLIPRSIPLQSQAEKRIHSNTRFMEQSCLLLEKKLADLRPEIAANKSEIEALDAKYQTSFEEFRVLKSELDKLLEQEKEKDGYYEVKMEEMEEFKERVRRRLSGVRSEVECIRDSVSQLRYTLNDLQDNDGYLNNFEIAIAEKRNSELLAMKEDLDESLASNYELRFLLQKQLQKILTSQGRDRQINEI